MFHEESFTEWKPPDDPRPLVHTPSKGRGENSQRLTRSDLSCLRRRGLLVRLWVVKSLGRLWNFLYGSPRAVLKYFGVLRTEGFGAETSGTESDEDFDPVSRVSLVPAQFLFVVERLYMYRRDEDSYTPLPTRNKEDEVVRDTVGTKTGRWIRPPILQGTT